MSVFVPKVMDYGGSGRTFENVHVGATNGRKIVAHGVRPTLDQNTTIDLMTIGFPQTAPSGTLTFVIESYANVAATQSAYLRLLWMTLAAGENQDAKAYSDEHSGGDLEIEHTTADNDEPIVTKIVLDANTITYGTDISVRFNIDLKSTLWDLAVRWTFKAYLIWE